MVCNPHYLENQKELTTVTEVNSGHQSGEKNHIIAPLFMVHKVLRGGGTGRGQPRRKESGRGTGGEGRGGGKQDSQGRREVGEIGEIMQHYAIFCN